MSEEGRGSQKRERSGMRKPHEGGKEGWGSSMMVETRDEEVAMNGERERRKPQRE